MLGWFADEADPDAGLLAFRRISDELGSTHWYLRLLRDEGSAAERLAHTLARSRFAADLLEQAPECVQFLGDSVGAAATRARGRAAPDAVRRRAARTTPRRRCSPRAPSGARSCSASPSPTSPGSLTLDALGAGDDRPHRRAARGHPRGVPARPRGAHGRTAAHAAPRRGHGAARAAASRATARTPTCVFVHDPVEGADEGEAQTQALEVVKELIRLLGLRGPDPNLDVDASLRPEGKSGPLVRSLASYREYYARWSLVWEAQALLRATPVAGRRGARRALPRRSSRRSAGPRAASTTARSARSARSRRGWSPSGCPAAPTARRTSSSATAGSPTSSGSCSSSSSGTRTPDPELRTTSTMGALAAAESLGLVAPEHAADLAASWRLASSMRNAGVLFRAKALDAVPTDRRDADGIARILGLPGGSGQELAERYRRVARRARAAHEAEFYDA